MKKNLEEDTPLELQIYDLYKYLPASFRIVTKR